MTLTVRGVSNKHCLLTFFILSIYAKDNTATYVTFYILTATNFPSWLTLCIKLLFYFTVTVMKEDIVHSNAM